MRNAVKEIGGAVEGIDDPARLAGLAGDRAALLHQEAERGPRALKMLADDLLGPAVGAAHEIRRPLLRDLKLLDLAEIAHKSPRRLAGGAVHHIDES